MKRIIFLAVLMVALVAMPVMAEVQNVQVSGGVNTLWLVRDNFNLGIASQPDWYQNLLITQTSLRVDADLTEKVSVAIALINERAWDESDSANTDVDLNLAYVELRDILDSNVSATIGRSDYRYENSFIFDTQGTNNSAPSDSGIGSVAGDLTKQTSIDTIKVEVDLDPLKLDLIAGRTDANNLLGDSGSGGDDDDVDIFGAHSSLPLGDDMGTQINSYFWAKLDQSVKSTGAGRKSDNVYTSGGHVSLNPHERLNVQGEAAFQTGNNNLAAGINVPRMAYAAQFIASLQIPMPEDLENLSPVGQFVYTHTSGDSDPTCTDTSTCQYDNAWDPMFENQGGGKIYNSIFNLTNSNIFDYQLSLTPLEDVTAIFGFTSIYLDKEITDTGAGSRSLSLVQPDGTTQSVSMTDDKHLGNEFSTEFLYDYTEDVQVGFGMNWFFPGDAFHEDNDQTAQQFLTNVDVAF